MYVFLIRMSIRIDSSVPLLISLCEYAYLNYFQSKKQQISHKGYCISYIENKLKGILLSVFVWFYCSKQLCLRLLLSSQFSFGFQLLVHLELGQFMRGESVALLYRGTSEEEYEWRRQKKNGRHACPKFSLLLLLLQLLCLVLLSRFIERQISIVWQQESRAFKSESDFQKNFNARKSCRPLKQ